MISEEEFLHFGNENYIYDLFENYQKDKNSVPKEWLRFFQGMELTNSTDARERGVIDNKVDLQRVIDYFKRYGHLYASSNSLEKQNLFNIRDLLNYLKVSSEDLNEMVSIKDWNISECKLSTCIDILAKRYCGSLGVEFFSGTDKEIENWFHKEINTREVISKDSLINGLKEIGRAKLLEEFLQKKFLGAKRFSVEGGESVLSLIKVMIDEAAHLGYKESYIGMAHRGRVNALCHIMEKPYKELFNEFKSDRYPNVEGLGDVKYHNGYKNKVKTYCGKEIYLEMAPNPSHLEAVGAVLPGMIRARLDGGLDKALGIVVHGDASVAGQGVVYEVMQFNKLAGYSSKGTVHVIIDNYIGFTALPEESRSTKYPSDIAKAFSIPVLHVNAVNMEDVIFSAKLAVKFHEKFHTDMYIHYSCHRLYGHNEADEPAFTNPSLYKNIKSKKDMYTEIKEQFVVKGWITNREIELFEEDVKAKLQYGLDNIPTGLEAPKEELVSFDLSLEKGGDAYPEMETKITKDVYDKVKNALSTIPENFNIHKKIEKLISNRKEALEKIDEIKLDWACGELMAYGSLVEEGINIRLSGQDSKRGTFSHRHSVYIDQENEDKPYYPLKKDGFRVYNSPLSEYGVMGFEYGYSLKCGKNLVIWEGQFGDFYNGATIIVDQYITSTKSKWNEPSSLILYLPHGMEGMGPEHSSGRIERFLQLAARKNLRIFHPTTPSQIFHLVRAQGHAEEKIPLIVFTPKNLLRNLGSCGRDLLEGKLEQILVRGKGGEKKLVFCSGKVGLELEVEDETESVAIVRLEQLYPFPEKAVEEVIKRFCNANQFIYLQEEGRNQGAYSFVKDYIQQIIGKKAILEYAGIKRLESTATGYSSVHKFNQKKLLRKIIEG